MTHYYLIWIKDWLDGKETGLNPDGTFSKRIKRYFMDFHNSKCQKCGWGEKNQYTNKIPLEIHHVDGNHQNNKFENLELLCPNCHALTATTKGANRGNGRASRRKIKL